MNTLKLVKHYAAAGFFLTGKKPNEHSELSLQAKYLFIASVLHHSLVNQPNWSGLSCHAKPFCHLFVRHVCIFICNPIVRLRFRVKTSKCSTRYFYKLVMILTAVS